jgi:hypothetical protein
LPPPKVVGRMGVVGFNAGKKVSGLLDLREKEN